MARSVSFAMWLLLLLATMVAAAWAIHHVDLGGARRFAPAEIAAESGVCRYTPGRLTSPPSAAEVAQARASWTDWSQVCRYDASRGFGAYPTADELGATRALLAAPGTMARGLAALWALAASLGLAATGHGLLVGSLSIFNPAFMTVGWWLLLPGSALAQAGWLGALGAGTLGALGPRYLRRRVRSEAARPVSRTWLTPKRIGLAAGGWLATVGVLAAVYPNVAALLPKGSPVVAEAGLPKVGSPSTVSGNQAGGSAASGVAEGVVDAVIAAPAPLAPPAGAETPDAAANEQVAELATPSPFGPRGTTGGASGTASGGEAAAAASGESDSTGPASEGSVEPLASALQAFASYFPPAPVPVAATPDAAPSVAPASAASPAPLPVATPGTEAIAAIAAAPIIDAVNPLPADPVALPQPNAPVQTAAVDAAPTPQPVVAGDAPKPPAAGPKAAADEVLPPVQPVPEPATLGLFALGVGALTLRRRRA